MIEKWWEHYARDTFKDSNASEELKRFAKTTFFAGVWAMFTHQTTERASLIEIERQAVIQLANELDVVYKETEQAVTNRPTTIH